MSRKLTPLADLKRQLSQKAAAAAPAPAPARKPARAQAQATPAADDPDLLKAAMAGVKAIKASARAELDLAKPAPVPRARPPEPKAQTTDQKPDDWIPQSWLREDAPAIPHGTEFVEALRAAGVRPIENKRVEIETPRPKPLPLQHERDEQAALAESIYAPTSLDLHLEGGDELLYLADGISRSVVRDLRRGRWVVQDQLDLHGNNRDEARDLLAASMGKWKKSGLRCVRVVHGKGRGSPGREPVLKKLVAGWLMNYAEVMAYCQARLPEGGAGALIVLLKASRPGPKT